MKVATDRFLAGPQGVWAESEFESIREAAAAGAEWAWRLIVDRYSAALFGYLRIRAPDEPQDALSETWLSAASKIGSFSGGEPQFRSWLFVIAHRRAVDAARRRSRRPSVVGEAVSPKSLPVDPSAEDEAVEALSGESALALLSNLTPDQRDVVALRVITDLSLEETANVVGKRVGAVKALQKRGLETLRRILREDRFLED